MLHIFSCTQSFIDCWHENGKAEDHQGPASSLDSEAVTVVVDQKGDFAEGTRSWSSLLEAEEEGEKSCWVVV
jgi:hypothetical protein